MEGAKLGASEKALVLVLLLALLGLSGCTAEVPNAVLDTLVEINVTTVAVPVVTPDGTGGAYVAYQKSFKGLGRITYLQRLDAAGQPQWPGAGTKIYLDKFPGTEHMRAPLGELVPAHNGAILVWYRDTEVRAQKADPSGNLLWGEDGVQVTSVPVPFGRGEGWLLRALSDGADGVVIASYADPLNSIRLDRLDAAGRSVWRGRQWSLRPPSRWGGPYDLDLAADAAGNLFVLPIGSTSWGVQKVNADGELLWGKDGAGLSGTMPCSSYDRLVADGAGGAIVLCLSGSEDPINSKETLWALMTQRLDAQGKPLWAEGGLALSAPAEGSPEYALVPDGAGGAVVVWQQQSGKISAQRVNAAGQLLWDEQGMKVSYGGRFSFAAGDRPGESLIAWGSWDTPARAQKRNSHGTVVWGADGTPATIAESAWVDRVLIATDAKGGAWVAWTEGHGGGESGLDTTSIQHIGADGKPLCGADSIELTALR
jgi:hypothetical protein